VCVCVCVCVCVWVCVCVRVRHTERERERERERGGGRGRERYKYIYGHYCRLSERTPRVAARPPAGIRRTVRYVVVTRLSVPTALHNTRHDGLGEVQCGANLLTGTLLTLWPGVEPGSPAWPTAVQYNYT
jgi:hypothetical protein